MIAVILLFTLILTSVYICVSWINNKSRQEKKLPSWVIGPFRRKKSAKPVIRPNPDTHFHCPLSKQSIAWEKRHTFNPAATIYNGEVHILYRAEDDNGPGGIGGYTSRLGLGISDNGFDFRLESRPVFYPQEDAQKAYEWTGGCEDPRLVKSTDDTFILTYTQYQGKDGGVRVGIASSKDLHEWTKYGSAFEGTSFENTRMKSAGILQRIENGQLVAAKVNNKYWMYFGELAVNIASSDDLIHWKPLVDKDHKMIKVMEVRKGFFDSRLTEVGPPPVLTDDGIVLIYNGKNGNPKTDGDSSLPDNVYTCGQALFDRNDPARLIARLDKPFFKPELDWEKSGQYTEGTTFAEGLVIYKSKWFLYYGCADTYVGTAYSQVNKSLKKG